MEEKNKEILDEINKKLDRLNMALIGDKDLKVEGLAQKVDRHDEHLTKIDRRNWSILGGLSVITALGWIYQTFLKDIVF